jgi:TPR repeat protein
MQYRNSLFVLMFVFGVSNVALADYEQGLDAVFRGDYQTAFREFTIAAENGLDLAQYNLAILYFTGQGVEQDLEQAFKWTEAAALQGHLAAQANLGSLYMEGSGVSQDVTTSIAWFSAAARGGHANSAFALANMYFDGDPVERDYALAHAWASLALLHEHPEAEEFRSRVERRMDSGELSTARRTFARWQIEPPGLPDAP